MVHDCDRTHLDTSFTDSGLNYSTIYYYRVLAVSSAGTSAASLAVGAVTSAQPDSPHWPIPVHERDQEKSPSPDRSRRSMDANAATPASTLHRDDQLG